MADIRVIICAIALISSVNTRSSKLCLLGDFDLQANATLEYVMLSETEMQGMWGVVQDLETTLQARWPGCKVHPFGSIVSGLGIKSSDVDVYVELPNGTEALRRTIVLEAQLAFEKQPELFKDFESRPAARVPIVTFVHIPTGTYCDVNFHSPFGVQNSELSGYLFRLDPRALHLAVLVKFWSTVHKLLGAGRMSSFAMSLLVIFYLQQRGVLPSVASLQAAGAVAFVGEVTTVLNPTAFAATNNDSLHDLMGGFFQYYSRFDFDKYTISPYAGRKFPKRLFGSSDTIPDVFLSNKTNAKRNAFQALGKGRVTVQDMVELDRNVAKTMTPPQATRILSHFRFAAEMYEALGSDQFLRAVFVEEKESESSVEEQNALVGGIAPLGKCMKIAKKS